MVTKTTKKIKLTKISKTSKTIKKVAAQATQPSDDKKKIIEEFATKKGDTGSPEVQIALLTNRITNLVTHLKNNPTDNHSRRGLLGMVSKRRRLINFLAKKNEVRAKEIMVKLELAH